MEFYRPTNRAATYAGSSSGSGIVTDDSSPFPDENSRKA
jgi:hypothetical protein